MLRKVSQIHHIIWIYIKLPVCADLSWIIRDFVVKKPFWHLSHTYFLLGFIASKWTFCIWVAKPVFKANPLPHVSHINVFFSWTLLMCSLKQRSEANVREHLGHFTGLLICFFTLWRANLSLSLNISPQMSHSFGIGSDRACGTFTGFGKTSFLCFSIGFSSSGSLILLDFKL